MQKLLMISLLCGSAVSLTGCAGMLQNFPGMGPPAATAPATPVFFQPFSAALDQPALNNITSAAKAANAQPQARVIVVGAADTVGSAPANKYLSETRAQVVADALVADGVAQDRIHTRAIGETALSLPANTPAQFSRRVLIRIQP